MGALSQLATLEDAIAAAVLISDVSAPINGLERVHRGPVIKAAEALLYACAENPSAQERARAAGALPLLVNLLQPIVDASEDTLRAAATACSALTYKLPASQDAAGAAGAVKALLMLLGGVVADPLSDPLQVDACTALGCLVRLHLINAGAARKAGAVEVLGRLAAYASSNGTRLRALWALGCLAASAPQLRGEIVMAGGVRAALGTLPSLPADGDRSMSLEAQRAAVQSLASLRGLVAGLHEAQYDALAAGAFARVAALLGAPPRVAASACETLGCLLVSDAAASAAADSGHHIAQLQRSLRWGDGMDAVAAVLSRFLISGVSAATGSAIGAGVPAGAQSPSKAGPGRCLPPHRPAPPMPAPAAALPPPSASSNAPPSPPARAPPPDEREAMCVAACRAIALFVSADPARQPAVCRSGALVSLLTICGLGGGGGGDPTVRVHEATRSAALEALAAALVGSGPTQHAVVCAGAIDALVQLICANPSACPAAAYRVLTALAGHDASHDAVHDASHDAVHDASHDASHDARHDGFRPGATDGVAASIMAHLGGSSSPAAAALSLLRQNLRGRAAHAEETAEAVACLAALLSRLVTSGSRPGAMGGDAAMAAGVGAGAGAEAPSATGSGSEALDLSPLVDAMALAGEAARAAATTLLQLASTANGAREAVATALVDSCGRGASALVVLLQPSPAAAARDGEVGMSPPEIAAAADASHAGAAGGASSGAHTAAALILTISHSGAARAALCKAGVFAQLAATLRAPACGTPTVLVTLAALAALTTHGEECRDEARRNGAIPALVAWLDSDCAPLVRLHALGATCAVAGRCHANRDALRRAGAVPLIVRLLEERHWCQAVTTTTMAGTTTLTSTTTTPSMQADGPLYAAHALTHLAARHADNQHAIAAAGGIAGLVDLAVRSPARSTARAAAERALYELAWGNASCDRAVAEARMDAESRHSVVIEVGS